MSMKKAKKGKTGCLKPNGRLKKGFRWAKSRKGFCMPSKAAIAKKSAKKKSAKRGPKRAKRGLSPSSHKAITDRALTAAMRVIRGPTVTDPAQEAALERQFSGMHRRR